MGLADRFRIDELTKKGSNAIRKDSKGNLLVSKQDGKQVKPDTPIISRRASDKTKADLANPQELIPNKDQVEFAGETSGYVEKPKYNEDELKKALDVKVDELIKTIKPKKGPYVLKSKYDAKLLEIEDLRKQVAKWRKLYEEEVGITSQLRAELEALLELLDSLEIQKAASENTSIAINNRYVALLSDFQNSIIKGTKEGIERVSLEAQVRGLQAQKVSLIEQIKILTLIEEQEEESQAIIAALTIQGLPGGYGQTRDSGWKVPEDAVTQPAEMAAQGAITFKSYRSDSGWPNGQTMNIYNLTEEPLDWSLTVAPKGNDSKYTGSPVFAFSPVTGTIAARSGETPGVATLTASKVRNLEGRKYGGREKWFTDTLKLTIGLDVFDIPIGFYRKVKNGGKGNS